MEGVSDFVEFIDQHFVKGGMNSWCLITGGVSAVKEPYGVSRKDGKRPDGCSLFPWSRGKCLLWDFTCGDTLAPSHVDQSSKAPGKVASDAENKKIEL